VNLAKKAAISLEKRRLTNIVSRVGLVLDKSGSMNWQYKDGKVQSVVDRILPLAVHFDDDGSLDPWCFASESKELTPVTTRNVRGYINSEAGGWKRWSGEVGGTNYEPAVIRRVIAKYQGADAAGKKIPAYVVGPEQCRLIRRQLDSRVRGQYPIARMNPSGLP
jgi:hypothetical protein